MSAIMDELCSASDTFDGCARREVKTLLKAFVIIIQYFLCATIFLHLFSSSASSFGGYEAVIFHLSAIKSAISDSESLQRISPSLLEATTL
jgi:hypothetical protein